MGESLQPRYSLETPSVQGLAPIRGGVAANRRISLGGPLAGVGLEGRAKHGSDARGGTRSVHIRRNTRVDADGVENGRSSRASGGNDSGSSRHRGVQFAGGHESSSSSNGGASSRSNSRVAPVELPALANAGPGGSAAAAAAAGGRAAGSAAAAGPSGVTLAFLESLAAASRPNATLRDLYRSLILPATRSARCAYAQLLGSEHRAKPTHVLVCSWDERVADVVQQVADFAASLGSQQAQQQQQRHLQPPSASAALGADAPLLRGRAGVLGGKASPLPMAGGAPDVRRSGGGAASPAASSSGGSGGGAGGGGSQGFAVWLDLFAINFNAAPAVQAAAGKVPGSAVAAAAPRVLAAAKPSTPTVEGAAQERARALPAAIAAAKAVLLLPGSQGAALREHPCTLAAWHALRGRGNGGGVSLSLGAALDVDVGLVQAAFEGLTVSTKATEDPTLVAAASADAAGAAAAGGSGGVSATTAAASRMSPERAAVRAIREGASACAANATAFVADPQPARTVREGLAAAAVAAANTLLSRPPAAAGSASQRMVPASPPLPAPASPLSLALRFSSGGGGAATSTDALFSSPSPPPQPPPLLSTTSRRALMPSPLRKGPSSRKMILPPTDAWSASSISPASSNSSTPVSTALTPSRSTIVLSAPGAQADIAGGAAGAVAPSTVAGGGPGPGPGRIIAHTVSGSGANMEGWVASGWVATWSSADGAGSAEAVAARRPRGLAPLPDGASPSSAEGSAAASPRSRMRGRSLAPWESNSPLPNPALRSSAAGLAGGSILAGALSPQFNRGGSTASSASGNTWPGVTAEDSGGAAVLPAGRSSPSHLAPAAVPPSVAGSSPLGPGSPASSEDAEGLARSGLAVLERQLGSEHEEVLAARHNLAAILAAAGRHDDAISLLQRVLSSPASQAKPLCAAALAASVEMASCLAAAGRQREARKLLRAQLRTLQEEEDEAAAVAAAAALAAARGRGTPPVLLPASTSASASATSNSGSSSAAPAPTSGPLPPAALPPGLPAPGRPGVHRSGVLNSPHGRDGSGSVVAAVALAAAGGLGGAASGSPSGSAAVSPAPGSPAAASQAPRGLSTLKRQELQSKCSHLLAQLKAAVGKTESARGLFRRAVEGYTAVYGSRHPMTADCMLGLASALHAAHNYSDALEQYRAVLELYTELYGPHHPATTRVSNKLGDVEEAMEGEESEAQEDVSEAEPSLRRGQGGRGGRAASAGGRNRWGLA
ncbi:hypothetical protein GPECTOR_5g287 [Gonium pectorale]|uniref:Uncharacterized protein n=1 Tax=Gonium pectorale TaxID=33097 RepID=A0A150GWU9_GONPE|nr:hypothetical protein GPECTOR_5g287 [Gonium pectorale]|eukprot:KXZ54192.1 hypothetical protein GPECTOR_5g287 [Gonium pectorale]